MLVFIFVSIFICCRTVGSLLSPPPVPRRECLGRNVGPQGEFLYSLPPWMLDRRVLHLNVIRIAVRRFWVFLPPVLATRWSLDETSSVLITLRSPVGGMTRY